jgi:5,10-methylene-tetrahydrofolate dehydrogenase/methenyl tetrahydrofolate cyclohydrolase
VSFQKCPTSIAIKVNLCVSLSDKKVNGIILALPLVGDLSLESLVIAVGDLKFLLNRVNIGDPLRGTIDTECEELDSVRTRIGGIE